MIEVQRTLDRAIMSVGANKHYAINEARELRDLGDGLEALRGYLISVWALYMKPLLAISDSSESQK